MKLFTKSAFKVAMRCPRQLYYYGDSSYANQQANDEFLKSLAEGGFQVGELAKIYCGVSSGCDLDRIPGNERQLAKTSELLASDRAVVAEAAFCHEKLFVRADIVRKTGDEVDLIEVKSKSWESGKPFMVESRGGGLAIDRDIVEYVYDVAFQKYVIALTHPEWSVRAFLMLPDKTKVASVDGMNQFFRIVHDAKGRASVSVREGAESLADAKHILTEFDVDAICNQIIDGSIAKQKELLHGMLFKDFVERMANLYCDHVNEFVDLSSECFRCPFTVKEDDLKDGKKPELKDGFKECWKEKAGLTDEDFNDPLIKNLWSGLGHRTRTKLFDEGKYLLKDVSEADIKSGFRLSGGGDKPLSGDSRRAIQIGLSTGRPGLVPPDLLGYVTKEGFYFDFERAKLEMAEWKYPLHMIDFETTAVALPFYKGMRPYEMVAFQFSHHTIDMLQDGKVKITHAGQYVNTKRGVFPNFEFVRALKENLEKDEGTIFRYSHHENTVLNDIREQLLASNEPDRDELVAFIESITHRECKDTKSRKAGPRDMVDLCELVKQCFYAPSMKGSNSIKAVLPAILNISKDLQAKYSKPIYGGDGEISSRNITSDAKPLCLVKKVLDTHGNVVVASPYKTLPDIKSYLPVELADKVKSAEEDECGSDISEVNNGGAALFAYGVLQFYDEDDARSKALKKALLRYCELDTMAMVFIWEFCRLSIKDTRDLCQQKT